MTMTEITYKSWKFQVDQKLTASTYATVAKGSAEEDESIEGINFAKQRDKVYPKEIKDLFQQLGIDYKKETEVSHHLNLENGMHIYTGWFHFKGTFEGPDYLEKHSEDNKEFNTKEITKKFSIGFRNESFLTHFEDRSNLVQVEFECMIPWVLDLEFEPEEIMEG